MSRPVPFLIAALLISAAALPARAQNIDRPVITEPVANRSLYGPFLAGREAMSSGDSRTAAAMLMSAAEARPEDNLLRERAFVAAIISGDVAGAARFAPTKATASLSLQGLGRLALATQALGEGKGAEADKILTAQAIGYPHRSAALLLAPFAAAAVGDWDRAVAVHEDGGDRIVGILDIYARAQILEQRKRYDEADKLYQSLIGDGVAQGLFWVPYGEFLERRGKSAEAVAIYDQGIAKMPRDAELASARARVGRHGRPPAASNLQRAAAQALMYEAAAMSAQRQTELALIYCRLALHLDPGLDEAWILTGDSLVAAKDEPQARAAWANVKPGARLWGEARTRTAYSLQRSGDLDAGLAAVREVLKGDPHEPATRMAEADLLRSGGHYAEAAEVLDELAAGPGRNDWRVFFMRASAREKLGRWPEAEADIKRALELSPDEPDLLNYLGYAYIDRGIDLDGGLALVQRAVAARPRSGEMKDSLGWAHFRMGDYAGAVEVLEAAVGMEPANDAVNDHLGDAYWMVGRKDEARFQWRRVLTLQPDAALQASVEAKLKDGLGAKAQVASQ